MVDLTPCTHAGEGTECTLAANGKWSSIIIFDVCTAKTHVHSLMRGTYRVGPGVYNCCDVHAVCCALLLCMTMAVLVCVCVCSEQASERTSGRPNRPKPTRVKNADAGCSGPIPSQRRYSQQTTVMALIISSLRAALSHVSCTVRASIYLICLIIMSHKGSTLHTGRFAGK